MGGSGSSCWRYEKAHDCFPTSNNITRHQQQQEQQPSSRRNTRVILKERRKEEKELFLCLSLSISRSLAATTTTATMACQAAFSLLRSTVCTYHVLFPTYFPKPISYLRLPMPYPFFILLLPTNPI